MNKRSWLYLLCLISGFIGCKSPSENTPEQIAQQQKLDSLIGNHQYFQARNELTTAPLRKGELQELLLRAKLHSVFNEREPSNRLISTLLTDYNEELTETQITELLETKINNSVFLFEYSDALKATKEILSLNSLTDTQRTEHLNTRIIYESLQDSPKQEVVIRKTKLPITKDLAGLSRIPASLNVFEQSVVFDTGANFSVITDSLALRSGIKIIGETFKVKAVTGGEVDSRIGIMDSLKLGNTLLRNVVFLVFPEESLSFPEANYTIDAILGFPVINALGELMLVRQEEFIITGDTSDSGPKNLALDFLTPIVEVHENGSSLPFTFDTGANSTALYEEYFNFRKEEVLNNGTLDSLRFGGAGGVVKVPVYYTSFDASIGQSEFHLDSVAVHVDDFRKYPGIYGNLGQDVLSQFDTIVMDFTKMSFLVK